MPLCGQASKAGRRHSVLSSLFYVFTDLKRIVTSNVSCATITVVEKGNDPGHGFCFVEAQAT
jgi:hypothetical protein